MADPTGLSKANKRLVKRFGGTLDRYGLGMVVIDCSEENLNDLLEAARAEGRPDEDLCKIADDADARGYERAKLEFAAQVDNSIQIAEAAEAQVSRLKGENERLKEALQPFADAADSADEGVTAPFPDHAWVFAIDEDLTIGDLRRARSALEDHQGEW